MQKYLALVLAVVLVLALALGLAIGIGAGLKQAWTDPAVVSAIADQERAKAEGLHAQADEQKSEAAAAAAWSDSMQAFASEWSKRWPTVVMIGLAVLVVMALAIMGVAAAWVRWSWDKAGVQALPGGLVAVRFADNKAAIMDPRRMVGGLVQLDASGALPMLQVSEELSADVARADLVARAIERVGGNETKAEIAARISGGLSMAFGTLAGAVSAQRQAAIADGGPALRFAKLRTPAEKAKAALGNDVAELKEFIEVGAAKGFQRREWANYKFQSTGRACSQTRWQTLAGWLREAELLDGPKLICAPDEALRRLELVPGETETQAEPDE